MSRRSNLTDLWHLGARVIESVHVNRVTYDADTDRFIKRRKPLPPGLIASGNLFLRMSSSGCEMFASVSFWLEHEVAQMQALHGPEGAGFEDPRAFWSVRLPGDTLRAMLTTGLSKAERAHAAAGRALRAMHELGRTHSDAHLGNVVFDGRRARWFDFDSRHTPDRDMVWRRADDLFVALLDACGLIEDERAWLDVAGSLLRGYGHHAQVFAGLRARLRANPTGFALMLHSIRSHHAPRERTLARQRAALDFLGP